MFVPHAIQTGMVGLHDLSGTPWWATIAISTVFVRLSLFPLVRLQILSARKFGAAMPEINFLYQLLVKRQRGMGGAKTRERFHVLSVFVKGVNACLELNDVSKVELVAYPLVNMASFVTFVLSVRDMIVRSEDYEFEAGGLLWFRDLGAQDATFVLPLVALGLSYYALELAFRGGALGSGRPQPTATLLQDAGQSLLLLSAPFVAVLPAGVFCYWIPSSLFAIAQTNATRNPLSMKLLSIPPAPPAPQPRSSNR